MEATEAAIFSGHAMGDTLRIRTMPAFGVSQLAPLIPAFCQMHPAICLEIQLGIPSGSLLECR